MIFDCEKINLDECQKAGCYYCPDWQRKDKTHKGVCNNKKSPNHGDVLYGWMCCKAGCKAIKEVLNGLSKDNIH